MELDGDRQMTDLLNTTFANPYSLENLLSKLIQVEHTALWYTASSF